MKNKEINNNALINIALIAIGDELLNGRTKDLNAHWLAQFLFEKGLNLVSLTFVRDSHEDLNRALNYSYSQSNIVITCGGIGPTLDDKTKECVAAYFHQEIIEHKMAQMVTEKNYARLGRPWIKTQNFYHMFPRDFIPLNNSTGFAPGLYYKKKENNQMLFSTPGVPREFVSMIQEEVFPLIQKEHPNEMHPLFQTVVRTNGVPEEKIFFELCPTLWSDLEVFGKVSSLPQTSGIDIIVTHHSLDLADYEMNHQTIIEILEKSAISQNIWHIGTKNIAEVVVAEAIKKKLTFSFAESCTGGLVSSKITDAPGSSEVFLGSIISYTNEVKINTLKVNDSTINNHTPVSIETACEMAKGVREKLKTTFGVSITGLAGPGGAMENIPVGTVVIGVSSKKETSAKTFYFKGDRKVLKERFSEVALMELWKLVTHD